MKKHIIKINFCTKCGWLTRASWLSQEFINTFESEKIDLNVIYSIVRKNFDLSPLGLIKNLDLLKPNYFKTASYGHFGREDQDFSWENPIKF